MLEYILLMAVGFVLLAEGSRYFVEAAAEIAHRLGVSEMVIGLTLVSASTTLPELMASSTASYLGSSGIAVGNVVGSDITNIALILGLCMVVKEYTIEHEIVSQYGVPLLIVCLLFCILIPGGISRIDGMILLAVFLVYLWKTSRKDTTLKSTPQPSETPRWRVVAGFVGGITAIFIGARFLVSSCLTISAELHVLESAIGTTVVALGTSLPELAVSLRAVTGHHEKISLGNILGANTFNLVWVTGVSALVNPLTLDEKLLYFNTPLMVAVTVILLAFMWTEDRLKRWEGIVFLLIYGFFVVYNFT